MSTGMSSEASPSGRRLQALLPVSMNRGISVVLPSGEWRANAVVATGKNSRGEKLLVVGGIAAAVVGLLQLFGGGEFEAFASSSPASSSRRLNFPWGDDFAPLVERPTEEYLTLCGGEKAGGQRCRIAVILGATSRKNVQANNFGRQTDVDGVNDVDESSLMTVLLPSLLRTIEPDRFDYGVYVAVDDDDAVWTDDDNVRHVEEFVRKKVLGGAPSSSGGMSVRIVPFPQPSEDRSKRRIPFNEIAREAYGDGYDYAVRVNDDTEFVTPQWTTHGVEALLAFNPPNVGMVGPMCGQGNQNVLTHDMVHLPTHLDIFRGEYYPSVFRNYGLDVWISRVYGRDKTRKMEEQEWMVVHRITFHGTRYKADTEAAKVVGGEVKRGREMVEGWLAKHAGKNGKVAAARFIHDVNSTFVKL